MPAAIRTTIAVRDRSVKKLTTPSVERVFNGTCAYKRGCGKKKDYCEKNRDCCRNFRCKGKKCKRR